MLPSSPHVGIPAVAPIPAVAATITSDASGLSVPLFPPPLPLPPPNSPPNSCLAALATPRPSFRSGPRLLSCPAMLSSTPTDELAPLFRGAGAPPMKLLIMVAGSMGPLPCVRPSGPTSPLRISRSRMMAVSACDPHRLVEQSRGVPSATGQRKGC